MLSKIAEGKSLVKPMLYQITLSFLMKASMSSQLVEYTWSCKNLLSFDSYSNSLKKIDNFWIYKKVSRPTCSHHIQWRSKWHHLLCLFTNHPQRQLSCVRNAEKNGYVFHQVMRHPRNVLHLHIISFIWPSAHTSICYGTNQTNTNCLPHVVFISPNLH